MEPEHAHDNDDVSIATALEEVIADEAKSQVTNAWVTILEMLEKAVEQPFHSTNLNAQGEIRSMV